MRIWSMGQFVSIIISPEDQARLTEQFDSGDHLHPGDKGNQAMAEAVNLDGLLGNTLANHE